MDAIPASLARCYASRMRTLIVLTLLLAAPYRTLAAGTASKKVEKDMPGDVTADGSFDAGVAAAKAADWPKAEADFRAATQRRPRFPEAWNGLGHSLKMQRKFDDALEAYDEALRQRPNFPEALEYLGETYVAMGKTADAQATLAKLKPLDAKLAERLEKSIADGKITSNW